jgi:hypothetical protein
MGKKMTKEKDRRCEESNKNYLIRTTERRKDLPKIISGLRGPTGQYQRV